MKKVFICKASPITADEPVEGVEIHIEKSIANFDNAESLEEIENFYKAEAMTIYKALRDSLPQGTRHQLLILMLQGKLELYKGKGV